jgi:hypothetical protein
MLAYAHTSVPCLYSSSSCSSSSSSIIIIIKFMTYLRNNSTRVTAKLLRLPIETANVNTLLPPPPPTHLLGTVLALQFHDVIRISLFPHVYTKVTLLQEPTN